MEYLVKMRNPKTQKIEVYSTEAQDQQALQPWLKFWREDAGYEILAFKEMPPDAPFKDQFHGNIPDEFKNLF